MCRVIVQIGGQDNTSIIEKQINLTKSIPIYQVLKDNGVMFNNVVICKVNGDLQEMNFIINSDMEHCTLELLTMEDSEILDIIRHDCAHILAEALKLLFKDKCQITIGPVINDMAKGHFYYDVYLSDNMSLTIDSLIELERIMKKIIKRGDRFIREEWDSEKAIQYFNGIGEYLKVEIIQDLLKANKDERITVYKQGDFIDLCRGPHGVTTKFSKYFKLLSVSGSYWRGDTQGIKLQRVYGTCWNSQKALDDYLLQIEEAKKRSHIVLAKRLGLMSFSNIAKGSVIWLPKGWTLFCIIRDYIKMKLQENGYQEVNTPIVGNRILWEKSGHWSKFKENMFGCVDIHDDFDSTLSLKDQVVVDNKDIVRSEGNSDDKGVSNSDKSVGNHVIGNVQNALKPMNCPFHAHIATLLCFSYQDLPLRLSEFGTCHRNEASGALYGSMRVRQLTQDDAHIFCTEEQLIDEVKNFCKLLYEVYEKFGFKNVKVKLSTRPEVYAGDLDLWEKAEKALINVLEEMKIVYSMNIGEGAFYGPKLEFVLIDALQRDWQCGTVQLDFVLPRRLSVLYTDSDNTKKYPVMIHRAILGSFERFIAILIEHYNGKFPLWLSPIQVVVNKISNEVIDYVKQVYDNLKLEGLRVEMDLNDETIESKIRKYEMMRIPIILNVGKKEAESNLINMRYQGEVRNISINEVIDIVKNSR